MALMFSLFNWGTQKTYLPATSVTGKKIDRIIQQLSQNRVQSNGIQRQLLNDELVTHLRNEELEEAVLLRLLHAVSSSPKGYDNTKVAVALLNYQVKDSSFAGKVVECFGANEKFIDSVIQTEWVNCVTPKIFSSHNIALRAKIVGSENVTSSTLMRYCQEATVPTVSILDDSRLPEEFVLQEILKAMKSPGRGSNDFVKPIMAVSNTVLSRASLQIIVDSLKETLNTKPLFLGSPLGDPVLKIMSHPNTDWELFQEAFSLKMLPQNADTGYGWELPGNLVLRKLLDTSKEGSGIASVKEKLASFPEISGMPMEWVVEILGS